MESSSAYRKKDWELPDDLSIISFDNIPYSGLINPPLTTMDMPARLLGQRACHLIIDSLNSNEDHNGITLVSQRRAGCTQVSKSLVTAVPSFITR
ncbi:MAG: substrate-binding domain-containing protein [Enterocloster sp.]